MGQERATALITGHLSRKLPDTITGISVGGYKSIGAEQRIEIRPLTLLAGANSSGKSSIVQPLLLLKQTLQAPYDAGALLLSGPNVQLTAADQILCKSKTGRPRNSFSVQFEKGDSWSLRLEFRRSLRRPIEMIRMTNVDGSDKIVLKPGMSDAEIRKALPRHTELLSGLVGKNSSNKWVVVQERCFLHLAAETDTGHRTIYSFDDMLRISSVKENILKTIHVPGMRGRRERTYPTASVDETFSGTFDNYTASLIFEWQEANRTESQQLDAALGHLGLTSLIEARLLNDSQIELLVARLPTGKKGRSQDVVNIADVGFGVSQSLPVVVALLAARPGQLVYIEEPEIHLHPRVHIAMARLLCDAANGGVQVVVETHSDLLLLGIQTLVAEGHIDPKLAKLHWFERDKEGITKVTSADLDEDGAYEDWPEDFGDVSLKADVRYLDAAETRLNKRAHA